MHAAPAGCLRACEQKVRKGSLNPQTSMLRADVSGRSGNNLLFRLGVAPSVPRKKQTRVCGRTKSSTRGGATPGTASQRPRSPESTGTGRQARTGTRGGTEHTTHQRQSATQSVRTRGPGTPVAAHLDAQEERVRGQFHDLGAGPVLVPSSDDQPSGLQLRRQGRVHLVPVAVPLPHRV